MSPEEEVHEVNRQVVTTAAKGDFGPFADVLDDGVEVVDHVAHLFEGKASFLECPQSVVADAESRPTSFTNFRGEITETTAVVDAYRRATMPKGGGLRKAPRGRVP